MEHKNRKLTNRDIEWATNSSKDAAEDRVASAIKYLADDEKKTRLRERMECRWCYYFMNMRIGGAATTDWNCAICDQMGMSSSTHCPKLCKACSEKYTLCRECGGDLHGRVRRMNALDEEGRNDDKDHWRDGKWETLTNPPEGGGREDGKR